MEAFLDMLQSFKIELLADIRNFPGSKRFPHFNSESLARSLAQSGISYHHYKDLGGRRKPLKDSKNMGWRLAAFRGYADYMETSEFQMALHELQTVAEKSITAYMCSEAVWWSCHRSLVSDQLKNKGWKVLHIMKVGKADEHPYTKPARIINGELKYPAEDLFSDQS
jgi:uncharacterized protein (DUF488 family)